jgi:hypothetical protein
MQSNHEQPDEGIWFDRLVDGELNQEEYRQLLSSLDERPAGWKQRALAFLEAQALGHELGGYEQGGQRAASDGPSPADDKALTLPDSRSGGAQLSPWGIAGIAASFLAVLGIGLWSNQGPGGGVNGGGVATQAGLLSGFRLGRAPTPASPAFELAGTECQRHLVNKVTLVVEGPNEKQQLIDLPVVEAEGDPMEYLALDSAVPSEVREALQRSGHQLQRRRQYIPVRLQDGRQMVLPIEEVEIVQVKPTY